MIWLTTKTDREEEIICGYCDGSGLGMHEGSGNCQKCNGSGIERIEEDD